MVHHIYQYQRGKQFFCFFQQQKAIKAIESVYTHKLSHIYEEENAIFDKNVQAAKKIQSRLYTFMVIFEENLTNLMNHRYGIERVVEDLIKESMSKGELKNLKGSGKPLQYLNHKPFIDVVTHKVNQVSRMNM